MAESINAPIPPAAAAKDVVTSTKEVPAGSADNTDPPLNPNQPNHKISTPAAAKGILCPGMACAFPLSENLPILGPKRYMAINAAHPPTECTNVDPAKS